MGIFNENVDILVPSGWRLCASFSRKLKTKLVGKVWAHIAFILYLSFGVIYL